MKHKPELMSPAGSMEALMAAVQNGADAVYLGGRRFNARQSAANFDDDQLKQAVEYAHIRGVKVYVTVNTLITDGELKDTAKHVEYLYKIGVDAVIVQDMGLVYVIKEIFPDMDIHASTQMTVYNLEGVKLLEDAGISRVVLARELSLEEVKHINSHSDIELEVFVQGALCMCYSGQCLMSSMIGGRSGNRGRCAQPCRLNYSIVDRKHKSTVYKKGYLLSPRDLFTLNQMDKLIEAGVPIFKIEGRMKRPEYVAAVTACYRKAIDSYHEYGKTDNVRECTHTIRSVFNRGFTGGYLLGTDREHFLSGGRPDNRGVPLGSVVRSRAEGGRILVKLADDLNKGDGIEIETEGKKKGTRVSSIEIKGKLVDKGSKGKVAAIKFAGDAKPGDMVFKTYDKLLMEELADSYKHENRKVPVFCSAIFKIGQVPVLNLWDDRDNMVTVEGGKPVEKALKTPVSTKRIEEQLCKTGETPYNISRVEMDADYNIFLPVSEINQLRREGLEKLNLRRTGTRKLDINKKYRKIEKLYGYNCNTDLKHDVRMSISVETGDPLAAESFIKAGVDKVFLRYSPELRKNIGNIKFRVPLFIKLPLVTRQSDLREISKFIEYERKLLHGVEISNPGQIENFKKIGEGFKIHGSTNLNIFNSLSLKMFNEIGCDTVTLSPELSLSQIKRIDGRSRCEIVVHGRLCLMTIEYPLLDDLSQGSYGLNDRKGLVFPLYKDGTGKTEICNSQTLFMLDKIEEVMNTGVGSIRLVHRDEKIQEFSEVLENYKSAIGGLDYNKKLVEHYTRKGITRGHFYRGV